MMVKPRDIRRKVFDRKVSTQDREMNVVSMKDIVRVLDGHYKVRINCSRRLSIYDSDILTR